MGEERQDRLQKFRDRQATSIENSGVADPDLDPDPHGSAFILVGGIRIRIGNSDPDLRGPK
jgi:hypothetical protein